MSRYEWAPGAPFKADPNEVQAEIERLRRVGASEASAIVDCVRHDPSSVLRDLIFNVEESEAAERYYLARASSILGAIRVVNEEGEVTHLRANVRVRVGEETSYLSIDEEAARQQRESWLRNRLITIQQELRELGLYPQIALAIQEELVPA